MAAALACASQQPQVLTPVPADTTRPTVTVTPVAAAAATPASTLGAPARTTSDDPLARIDRMDWPGPNEYRTGSGSPGRAYWQQRADYTIAAALDTTQQRVSGTVTIHYTNNSPDSLRFVWLQLDQNLYRPGSKGSALFPADSRWGVRGFAGGYDLSNVQVNGRAAAVKVDDTMGRIDLDRAIAPKGGKATITMSFAFDAGASSQSSKLGCSTPDSRAR